MVDVELETMELEELYDLAEETEGSIKGTQEMQLYLLDLHEKICCAVIEKAKE